MASYTPEQSAKVNAAIDNALRAFGTTPARVRRPKVTAAKAQRLVDALAALQECDDLDPSCDVPFNDARAVIEQYL